MNSLFINIGEKWIEINYYDKRNFAVPKVEKSIMCDFANKISKTLSLLILEVRGFRIHTMIFYILIGTRFVI